MDPAKILAIRRIARQRLHRYCDEKRQALIELVPIDPASVAATAGLRCEKSEAIVLGDVALGQRQQRVDAMLDRRSDLILYAADAPIGRQRFSIAHELGHNDLHAHTRDYRGRCSSGLASSRRLPWEQEADVYASEIVMPHDAVCEFFFRTFGGPLALHDLDEAFWFWLKQGTDETADRRSFENRGLRYLSRLLARTTWVNGEPVQPLYQRFLVSLEAMTNRLMELPVFA